MLITVSVVVLVLGSVEQSRLPARLIITLHGDPTKVGFGPGVEWPIEQEQLMHFVVSH